NRKVKFATPAAAEFLRELDEFIHEHRERTFTSVASYDGSTEEVVLGSASEYNFTPPTHWNVNTPRELPLLELWENWWSARSPRTRDADGLELVRARAMKLLVVREGEEAEAWDYDDEDDEDRKVGKAEQLARKQLNPLPPVAVRYDEVINGLWPW